VLRYCAKHFKTQYELSGLVLFQAQHALQKTDKALETLQLAIDAAPENPLCKFEKASILFSSERYHEALQELTELKALAPKESPVYFLIGKVHNKLNNTHLALMHFSWAMDLDPKVANSQIKDALDPTLNRVAQEDSTIMDDPLVVEDLEASGIDHTEEDVVMMQGKLRVLDRKGVTLNYNCRKDCQNFCDVISEMTLKRIWVFYCLNSNLVKKAVIKG
jgi:anaphase-promoting complex subunit 3